MVYYIVSVLFLLFFWCPCMAINVSVQYNGGLRRECVCSASREICCAVNFSRLGGESASRGFTGAR